MDDYTRRRLDIMSSKIRKKMEECTDLKNQGGATVREWKLAIKQFEGTLKLFGEALHQTIHSLSQRQTPPTETQDLDAYTTLQLEAEELLCELELDFGETSQQSRPDQPPPTPTSNLPKLELAKFNGNILAWQHFWGRFSNDVDRKPISDAEKFSHLQNSLEGDALDLVSGFLCTDANYQLAVAKLKEKYGRKSAVIAAHFEALTKIEVAKPNISDCRRIYTTIEKHLGILESFGEDVKNNTLLKPLILSKFPDKVKFDLRMKMSPVDNTVQEIRELLDQVISAHEEVLSSGPSTEQQSQLESIPSTSFTTEALYAGGRSSGGPYQGNSQQGRSQPQGLESQQSKKRKGEHYKAEPQNKIKRVQCTFCKENHYSDECKRYPSIKERKDVLKGRCYICLRSGHSVRNCQIRYKCNHCFKWNAHHRSLCPNREVPIKEENTKTNSANTHLSLANHDTILQTAVAQIKDDNERRTTSARILLDCGSQKCYVSSRIAKQLKLRPLEKTSLTVYTFGTMTPRTINTDLVTLKVMSINQAPIEIVAYVVPVITGKIPVMHHLRSALSSIHRDRTIAPDTQSDDPADLLIGNDYYFSFVSGQKLQVGPNLYLLDSSLGWIVSGSYKMGVTQNQPLTFLTFSQSVPYLEELCFTQPDAPLRDDYIRVLWDLETIGIRDSPKMLQHEEIVQYFNDTVKSQNNRYFVKWPWAQYPPQLPVNFGLSLGRLKGLLKRMEPHIIEQYDTIFKEQIRRGIIEEVTQSLPSDRPVHYLPHHGVIQESKTTKLRIVYDASSKTKGQCSLNDFLYKGPLMLEDLVSLLIGFRTHNIGIISDVEKAFLMVGLQEEDRDVARFLWIKDWTKDATEDNLIHFRFCRVPFGVVSSPFLLAATIQYHLSKRNNPFTKMIANNIYVDNLITGCDTTSDAMLLYQEAISAFNELSMNIREWNSNNQAFLDSVPEDKRSGNTQVSVLGLTWDTMTDKLSISVDPSVLTRSATTKREVTRIVASVFDPCGFCAPLLLKSRLFLQSLWAQNIDWDTQLPETKLNEWVDCAKILEGVKKISLARFLDPTEVSLRNRIMELHCFVDASDDAYSAVVYLRNTTNEEKIAHTNFVMSRTRLTPLKQRSQMTTPKLELLAMVIGTRLMTFTERALKLSISKRYLWSDSQIALSWIKSDKLLTPFVARRVAEIKNSTEASFRYIDSKNNPADISTRPYLHGNLPELWWHGPEFLQLSPEEWPNVFGHFLPNSDLEGMDCEAMPNGNEHTVPPNGTVSLPVQKIEVSATQIIDDGLLISLQRLHFPQECKGETTPLTKSLNTFVDEKGLLRCKGRLQNSDLHPDQKYPILLPRHTPTTEHIIKEIHRANYHVGVSHTLALVRKRYWVPKGRAQVAKVLRTCDNCVKYGGGPYKLPEMPPLPPERVKSCPPFTYSGLDYLGPLTTTNNGIIAKRWICLFTCMSVRAIHLEVVQDCTAEEFLLGLRRFVATRGTPSLLVSDNALQFKLTATVLRASIGTGQEFQWRFITQLAPWQGGFYERLVGLVKHCLKRTIDKCTLSDVQLLTVVKEIESVVNSRPLTTVGTDLEHVLTPQDFLRTCGCTTLEPIDPDNPKMTITKEQLIRGWKRTRQVMNEFSKMFSDMYLASLHDRRQHYNKQPRILSHKEPALGDVVQVKGDTQNRAHWNVGRISALIKGSDGEIRSARVTLPSGVILTRSIGHLCPLEVDVTGETQTGKEPGNMHMTSDSPEPPTPLDPALQDDERECDRSKETERSLADGDTHGSLTDSNNDRDAPTAPGGQDCKNTLPGGEDCKRGEDCENTSPRECEPHQPPPAAADNTPFVPHPKRAAAEACRRKLREWTQHLLTVVTQETNAPRLFSTEADT